VDWVVVWGRQARQWFAFQLFMLPGGAMAFGLPYIWERLRGSQTAAEYILLIMIWVPFCLLTNLWVPLVYVHRLRRLHRTGKVCEAEVLRTLGWLGTLSGCVRVRLTEPESQRGKLRWCTGLPEQLRDLSAGARVSILLGSPLPDGLLGPTACLPLWDLGKEG
jgi:hypothetical protein